MTIRRGKLPELMTMQEQINHTRSLSHRPALSNWLVGSGVFLLCACMTVAASATIYFAWQPPKKWGEVMPGKLYRSGQIDQSQVEQVLAENDIDVIVNLLHYEEHDPNQVAELVAAHKLGIPMHRFPLGGDSVGDPDHYILALSAIHHGLEKDQRVLVHCAAGAQRTGAAVAMYRMLVQGWTGREAYRELPKFGWTPGKDQILLDYVNEHLRYIANGLVERGVIDRVPEPIPVLGP